MQNKRWLRYSLTSLTVMGVALGSLLVACSDDDDNKVVPQPDSGGADTGTPVEPTDAGTDGSQPEPDAGTPARLQMVNAATDFGTHNKSGLIRVCFAAGTTAENVTVTPLPALPDQSAAAAVPPGVPIGIGGNLQGTGLDLTSLYIQPYLMNGESLFAKGIVKPGPGDPGTSCAELLKPDFDAGDGEPLKENEDYWKLPVIPANTLLKDKSYLLVLTGCTGDTDATPLAKCGPNPPDGTPGIGNLKIHIHELDNATAVEADKIGTQFIHASAQAAALLPGMPGMPKVTPGYIKDKDDAATFKPVSGDGTAGSGEVALNAVTQLVQVEGVDVAADSFTVVPAAAAFAIKLSDVEKISFPAGAPADAKYRNGAAFTFLAVGDPDPMVPAEIEGKFNPKKFHYLAFPNNPPVAVYQP